MQLTIVQLFQKLELLRKELGFSMDNMCVMLHVTKKTYLRWIEGIIPSCKYEIPFILVYSALCGAIATTLMPLVGMTDTEASTIREVFSDKLVTLLRSKLDIYHTV